MDVSSAELLLVDGWWGRVCACPTELCAAGPASPVPCSLSCCFPHESLQQEGQGTASPLPLHQERVLGGEGFAWRCQGRAGSLQGPQVSVYTCGCGWRGVSTPLTLTHVAQSLCPYATQEHNRDAQSTSGMVQHSLPAPCNCTAFGSLLGTCIHCNFILGCPLSS